MSTARRCSVRIVRRRPVVGPNVLEHRVVAVLLRVVIDDEIDLRQQAREVMRLHVHQRDAIEALDLLRGQHLDLQVEQLQHPQVLRPADAVHAADDGRLTRAAQQVAQRQAAGDRVGIGIVVQQDQDAIGVRQIALILLDLLPGHRASQLDDAAAGRSARRASGW